jgi:hypothetical protein
VLRILALLGETELAAMIHDDGTRRSPALHHLA